MNLKLLVIGFFVMIFSIEGRSQNVATVTENKKSVTEQKEAVIVDPANVKDNAKVIYAEGSIPTPEVQGFTKKTIGGNDVYFKEEGQIKIEYTPKK